MEPSTRPDPIFRDLTKRLIEFRQKELPMSSNLDLRKHAEAEAKEILLEAYTHFEQYATGHSAIAKYDLLKWIHNKKAETRYYK